MSCHSGLVLFNQLWEQLKLKNRIRRLKFEIAVMMIGVAIICNTGFLLSLGSKRTKFKKITALLLLIAAFFNFCMFVSISHSPFQLLEEVQWYFLRKILAYGSVLFSLVVTVFVLRHEK